MIIYNVTKGIGRVCSVSNSSAGCWKVCGDDCPRRIDCPRKSDYLRRIVQSGHMVAERGVKPLSAIACLMK